ncbi:sulfite exporter TauE/SafE family protein [Spirosoma sp. KUDC1026]|uniref:sulfite exporter TauE/SafE family protein n=1 Tax=Spirosoma sp. KUDC1026 TaxID=2745947 RepID=UPI00159BEE33|nr:sulfite exporter TauE/SafE family protein [Spirosoma sp. KUDC1026]QKZ13699.1 sulfite exporter TauE/SafE family protein [Spirosoma sp. KUDC1026]
MQSDDIVPSASAASPTVVDGLPIDLNGLTINIQGDSEQAKKQVEVLRKTFPDATVNASSPHLILRRRTRTEIAIYVFAALALMVVGHWLFSYFTLDELTLLAGSINITPDIFYFIMAGFVAQMIDGALGMAYGVTATTFLTSVGISPVFATASVHSSEIFTSGVSGYMHLKFGNINSRLFKAVLIPGVIGAALGAYLITSLSDLEIISKYLNPIISVYTAILGVLILKKALTKQKKKTPVRRIGLLAWFGGFVDAIGGGGWGPIVNSTLIAAGRHPRYTIGSVNLAEFFVSFASSVVFALFAGLDNYGLVILGLILGGMIAAPIAALLSSRLPIKTMMVLVGIVIIIVSLRKIILFF